MQLPGSWRPRRMLPLQRAAGADPGGGPEQRRRKWILERGGLGFLPGDRDLVPRRRQIGEGGSPAGLRRPGHKALPHQAHWWCRHTCKGTHSRSTVRSPAGRGYRMWVGGGGRLRIPEVSGPAWARGACSAQCLPPGGSATATRLGWGMVGRGCPSHYFVAEWRGRGRGAGGRRGGPSENSLEQAAPHEPKQGTSSEPQLPETRPVSWTPERQPCPA